MQQSLSSRLTRWTSLPLPAPAAPGRRPRHAVGLAQLWPVFGVLILLCAALWGIGEYAGHKAELRRAETERYLAQFHAPPVADAWQRLHAVWRAEEARQSALLGRLAGLSGAALEQALRNYRHFVLETVEEHRLGADIETVRAFFGRLGVCIRIGSCDAAVARAELGPALWRFRAQHYDYFALEGQVAEVNRVVSLVAPEAPRRAPAQLALK